MAKNSSAKKKAPIKKAPIEKTPVKKPAAKKKRAISRQQRGRLLAPGPGQDLTLEELRDRVLIELAAVGESDRVSDQGYKMVLVIKRTKKSPLSYKLVVERS